MKTVGLFAGIGGIEEGLSQAGHETILLCEFDESCKAVLSTRFGEVPLHSDIRDLDSLPRGTELLTAGFPCQDLSQAGRTIGITGTRSGLIGHVFRLLRQNPVPWVLLENVPFMLQLAKGQAMEVIIGELERLGYKWAYRVINALSFGLPQRRKRVFLLASSEGDPRRVLFSDSVNPKQEYLDHRKVACGFYWTEGIRGLGWAVDCIPTLKGGSTIGIPSPPAVVMPSGLVGRPDIRDAERLQGLPGDWTEPAEFVARPGVRWRLVGNAVAIPVVKWLGLRLKDPGNLLPIATKALTPGCSWPAAAWNVDGHRVSADIGDFPVTTRRTHLEEFLLHPLKPLSQRATTGFLSRTARSSLRFPEGFLDVLRSHLKSLDGDVARRGWPPSRFKEFEFAVRHD